MEKIAKNPDHFESALMKTFSKVNKIGGTVHGVTIGPHSEINKDAECNGDFPPTVSCENYSEFEALKSTSAASKFDLRFSYAAKALREMENLRKIDVLDNVNERARKLMQTEEQCISKMDDSVKLCKEEMDIKKLKSKINESSIHDEDLIISQKILDLILRNANNKSKSENKAMESNTKIDDEELKLKRERIQTLAQIQSDYRELHKQIVESVVRCKNRGKLVGLATPDLRRIQELDVDLNSIIEKAKSGNVEDRDLETCSMVLKCVTLLADKLKKQIDQINVEEDRIVAEQQKATEILEETENEVPTAVDEPVEVEQTEEKDTLQLGRYVCKECLDYYIELCEKLDYIAERANAFSDSTPKDVIRNLKIAINTPVNSLSSESAVHMLDKFNKIAQLLRGNFSMLNVNTHNIVKESCIPFIIDFLSKRFISHAEKLLVPAKPEDAFCLASIIVALWIEFPDLGPVLIGYIMKKCPYTIPAYWPQYKGQSDKEYYISRGYQYNSDGTIEDQSSFLKRMTGIFMLYVAIIVTIPRRNRPHPYGLQNAWKWMAATINLEPRSDITAALIHTFLKMSGFKLAQFYGIQFWKIMFLLNHEYFMKIEKVTNTDFRGPVSRLKEYLENVLRHNRINEPKGILSATAW